MSEQLRDLLERAGWTFLQAFLGALILLDNPFSSVALVGAFAAGLSALKTLARVRLKELNNK